VRIFFTGGGTGGHLYPALNIARAVVAIDPTVRPFFIGAKRGIERDVLPGTEFPFELLDLHPLYRSRPWENYRTLASFGGAWRRIGALAKGDRPAAVMATGGYAAGATLAYAAAHGIPIAIQEQNSFPGLTVRFFSRFARELYLGFPEGAEFLPPRARPHAIDTGNPIAPPPALAARPPRGAARERWGFPASGGPVVLVFGGSQGSAALNAVVDAWAKDGGAGLPAGAMLLWATGRSHYDRHKGREAPRVRVVPYLSPIADAYAAADLAFTRAGAMTTAELVAWGIPSILVPLPTAAADHQTTNARTLAAAGAARMILQRDLTAATLDAAVRDLVASPDALQMLAAGATRRARPDAAEDIARRLLTLARGAVAQP
jgi:UDP-N-acetylglucosamine--N-acetylmuramyl-(pentapeptide) pyrophosphoryl-undecaprenol N-acetylglucosamine transferase